MDSLKLRKVGNSLVVTIPVDVLNRYGLKEGDSLTLDRGSAALTLTSETKRERQIRIGREVMNENREALALLANPNGSSPISLSSFIPNSSLSMVGAEASAISGA